MAGSLILLDTETASNSSSITVTGMVSGFDVFRLDIINAVPATDGIDLRFRFTESGTPNETANYDRASNFMRTAVGYGALSGTDATYGGSGAFIGNATGEGHSSLRYIFNSQNASKYTMMTKEITQVANSGELSGEQGADMLTVNSVVNGVQFFMGSGNITSGVFKLYAIKN